MDKSIKEMVGKIALCQHGKLGIITKVIPTSKYDDDYPTQVKVYPLFCGLDFNGKPWQSIKPTIIANSINEYFHRNELGELIMPLSEDYK